MVERSEASEARGARLEHVASFRPWCPPRSDFDKALLRLLELQARDGRDGLKDGRRKAMLEALEGKATWSQIREWRRGRINAPQWARAVIATKLRERAANDLEAESGLKNKTAGD